MSYITDVVFITSEYENKAREDTEYFQKVWKEYIEDRYDYTPEPLEAMESMGPKFPSLTVFYVTFNYVDLSRIIDHKWASKNTAIYIDHEEEPYYHYVIRGGE